MTEIRCVKCKRLLMKIDTEGALIETKCPKCNYLYTFHCERKDGIEVEIIKQVIV